MNEQDTNYSYITVKNAEEQYSIWPAFKDVPLGWNKIGEPAEKQVCLDYIAEHWTDMRPKSIR